MSRLSKAELDELLDLEQDIETGLGMARDGFVMVGRALSEISDKRVYCSGYGTFEDYCLERWEIKREHAYRCIQAAKVADRLESLEVDLPRLDVVDQLKRRESRLRALDGMSEQQLIDAVDKLYDAIGRGAKLTVDLIESIKTSQNGVPNLGQTQPKPPILTCESDDSPPAPDLTIEPETSGGDHTSIGDLVPALPEARPVKAQAIPKGPEVARSLATKACSKLGEVVRLLEDIAETLGSKGTLYAKARSALNDVLRHIKAMGDGKP